MTMTPTLQDPGYWRDRAEETRAKAESLAYRNSRERLLKIAEEYDRLAIYAEQWQLQDQE
jgi:hypothetical protein